MDSFSKKDIHDCDSKDTLIAVEETWKDMISSKGSVSSMRWLIVTIILGFAVMFFLVVWQQTQLNTMQLELDNLLKDEIDALKQNLLMDEELKINENGTEKAVNSRHRRQAYNHQSPRLTPFAHLVKIMNRPNQDMAYQWSRPSSSRNSLTDSYYTFVQLYPSNGGSYVQAIEVPCSGWYYVYAQVPYNQNSGELLGHKIVRVGDCGRGYPESVLQTLVHLPNGQAQQNWKYLGGIVHLAAGDHVEVQPVTASTWPWLNTGSFENRKGSFFGLYQVRQETPLSCNSCR